MSTLPVSPLVVSYNGVVFPTETETVELSVEPVFDPAGRAVMFTAWSITLRAVFGQANQLRGETTDGDMTEVFKRLNAPAGAFFYQNVGCGNVRVNAGDGIKDVQWGPKPRVLKWKPLGQLSCEVTWTVEFRIPLCDPATYEFALMSYNFTLTWDVDASGYTRRTFQGHLSIPQTRKAQGDRTLSDQADQYRELVYPPALAGFRRIPGTYKLSEDKCRLDFSLVDEEAGPYYPPPGVVQVEMSHEVSTNRVYGGQYVATVSASYEVARDQDRAAAMRHFLNAAIGRAESCLTAPYRGTQPQKPILLGFRAAHPEVYGRRAASFSSSWLFLSTLEDLIEASGLWKSPPDSDPALWADSLANTAFHRRGNAKLSFAADGNGQFGDVLIDLCAQGGRELRKHAESPEAPDDLQRRIFTNPVPEPGASWLQYESEFFLEQVDDTPDLKLLPGQPLSLSPLQQTAAPQEQADAYVLSTAPLDHNTRPAPNLGLSLSRVGSMSVYGTDRHEQRYVSQVKNTPTFYAHLNGMAVRAGFEVTPPALLSVGGCQVVPANREGDGFGRQILGSYFGLTLYGCWWSLRYRVLGVPQGDAPVMDGPFVGDVRPEPEGPEGPPGPLT